MTRHRAPAAPARPPRADEGGALGTGRPAECAARARARGRRSRGGTLLLPLLLLVPACAEPPSPAAGVHAAAAHAVTYALDWAQDDVAASHDGGGFTVTSDLGYTVHVSSGWITSYGVELVECPREPAGAPLALLGALLREAIEGTAWAGHSTDAPNPAAVHPMQVESLTDVVASDVATLELAPQAYCKLHYLLARAGAEARGLPPEPDMVGTSLHVDGTYRAPGAASEVRFTLQSASAYGALVEVESVAADARPLRVDTGDGAARVTIRRRRARMFDGVDFARMPERAAALQVLRSLVAHVDVRVERAGAGSRS